MMLEINGTSETKAAQLTQRNARAERNRRLQSIKMQRRRVRREKWWLEIKTLANVLSPQSATTVN